LAGSIHTPDLDQRAYDLENDYGDLLEETTQMLIDHDQKGTPVDQRKLRRMIEIVSIYMGVPMKISGISYADKGGDI
jgi:hypothetical protein